LVGVFFYQLFTSKVQSSGEISNDLIWFVSNFVIVALSVLAENAYKAGKTFKHGSAQMLQVFCFANLRHPTAAPNLIHKSTHHAA